MKKSKLTLLVSTIASFCIPGMTYAVINELPLDSDCSQLNKPYTAFIVYGNCPHCQQFMPTAETVSNNPKYTAWSFYKIHDPQHLVACGKPVTSVPIVYLSKPNGGDPDAYVNPDNFEKLLDDHSNLSLL